MSDTYDVAVIGAGPAGYVAAIRSAQLGLKTACIDRWTGADGKPALGGTCLNVGCIPSKALLDSTERYHSLRHGYKSHGIAADNVSIDVSQMMRRKDEIVASLTKGVESLLKANQVEFIHGHGRLLPERAVEVLDVESGAIQASINAEHVILASGSTPIELPNIPFDSERIVDSAGALEFPEIPQRLGIVGAGVIGLELGSVWRRLGSSVVVLEALDEFLPAADADVAKEARRQFKRQGLDIRLNARVESAVSDGKSVNVEFSADGQSDTLSVDRLIVCVGRRPYTANLFSENSGVKTDQLGFIQVDDQCWTGVDKVYAIGDSVRGPMLAHKGSEEGVAVAERIATGYGHINYETVPWAIYTSPEIAWVGLTERQATDAGIECQSGSFPFAATGRAKAMEETDGFVKIIARADDDRILGVHVIGPHASELIAEAVVAMEFHASSEDLARIIHAHPTLTEAMHEAALAVERRAIHKIN